MARVMPTHHIGEPQKLLKAVEMMKVDDEVEFHWFAIPHSKPLRCSPNETSGDISTRDLIYLLVHLSLEVTDASATEREDRLESLEKSQRYLKAFLDLLENYHVIPEDEIALYQQKTSTVMNPASRRELKIKQYLFQTKKDHDAGESAMDSVACGSTGVLELKEKT
ncbi:Type 2A phosphatase-associated protein 42 [Marasmius tenuissimus]|uniref:Type 2A phosphatase-associated protein 42 n=1 Tax=Marasmius tenuissimus TaxID=585030 RepID=A0ABR2ZEG6_9AGAR